MNFRAFDLNLLRVLDALLHEGSTVRAAEKLGLSQPAVSAALSRLRHALGDPLFVRQGSRLVPTDNARGIALALRQELDRIEEMLSLATKFDPATAEGVFRISGSDFFAEMLLPRLGQVLGRRAPGLKVQFVDLVPTDYISSLEQYRADLALVPDAGFPDWLQRSPMFHSRFVTVARADHPGLAGLEAGAPVPLDLFCDLGHAIFSPAGRMQAMGDAALERIGRRREVAMTLPVFSGVCRVVAESELIAIVPKQLAEMLAPQIGLRLHPVPVEVPVPVPLIVAIWHKRASANPLHRFLRGTVAEILRPMNAGEAPLPP